MNFPPTNRTRLHVNAEIEIEGADEPTPVPVPEESDTVTLSGRVTQARTGTALPGLRVLALANADSDPATPLGSSTSNTGGRFHIQFDGKPEVRERLLALRYLPESRLFLRVESGKGDALFTSDPIALDRPAVEVTLAVPIPETPVPAKTWATLGDHLVRHRIGHLNGVVRLLSGDGASGQQSTGLSKIPLLTRQTMLHQIEQAFLDPTGILQTTAGEVPTLQELHDPELAQAYAHRLQAHHQNPEIESAFLEMLGKAASFASLAEVDWTIDPQAFNGGDIGAAINKFSDQYKIGDIGIIFLPHESNLTLYRDYLLAIWTKYAIKIVYRDPPDQLTEAQALDQLEMRFHQRFTTHDDAPRTANAVLVSILHAILTAPTGKGFGFGIAAGVIAAQGTRPPRAYLDELIGLAHVSAAELGLRFRLDFTRPDTALSSPVQENIATLQGFFRDSFQCELDPTHVDPDIHNQPIIPDKWQGNAPFFLYYDEWLRQQEPFYPENHLDIRRVLPVEIVGQALVRLADLAGGKIAGQNANVPQLKFCQKVLAVWDKLQAGHVNFYAGEYGLALIDYRNANNLAGKAMQDNVLQTRTMTPYYDQRKKLPFNSMKDLPSFMNPIALSPAANGGGFDYGDPPDVVASRLAEAIDLMALRLAYHALFTIPVCLGDAEFALGDYEHAIFHYGQATRFEVGIARETDSGGYRPIQNVEWQMYSRGDKPYTVRLNVPGAPEPLGYFEEEGDSQYDETLKGIRDNPLFEYAMAWSRRIPHLAEVRYCRLRQANVMLEWADALYRLNEPTSMARARELYKGVLWLHGTIPPICPTWPRELMFGLPSFRHHAENPALVSQTSRAYRGIYQIDHGLNYYGEHDNIVPILRYRPLKDTADRTAAMARGAQQDFLQYTERVEAAMTARLQLANFLQKAKLQSAIADEQQAIAAHDVVVAQDQVAAVKAAIKAKEDEIAEHDSLFGQIGDAISGVKSIVKDIPDDTKSAVGAGVSSEATGNAMVGEGMLGLGAGASVMTGFGIFAVVGYVTLSGMSDAANKRTADLNTLGTKALPAAEAAVEARQHGVTITRYQKQIAQADVDLAQTLLAFEQNRTLNQNFWLQLAQVARRLLRRYLEMGARMAWLAERALAYEQDRALQIVRMDYFPAPLQGVTGADLMQADLAELEATRIEGMKRTVPVRRTLSLAREFPLQYGQLKKTGRCTFRTEEAFFRRAHPGTSAYRIRAVSVTVQQRDFAQPLRGSLINRGVSISKPQQALEHLLVRPGESLPLSEFRLEKDMAVYGLPNETLLTFEGSSIETFWELGFPKAANASGLDGLVDVLLTFDLFCEFAPERFESELAALPNSERKWILVSAAQFHSAAVTDLAGAAANVDVVFDLRRLRLLPRQETSRHIKNMAVFVVTPDEIDFTAKLLAADSATSVPVTFQKGFAISTLQPDPALPPLPASPLNAFAEMNPDQAFTLSISKPSNPGVDFHRVTDVVLAIEYEASLV
jgi:Tc toxin complex TcA C-terminal TcB-binding domain